MHTLMDRAQKPTYHATRRPDLRVRALMRINLIARPAWLSPMQKPGRDIRILISLYTYPRPLIVWGRQPGCQLKL